MTAKSVSKICSDDGCDRPSKVRGLCDPHYRRFRKSADYTRQRIYPVGDTPELAFWSLVTLTADIDRCWEWQAGLTNYGYGQARLSDRQETAHRVAWFYVTGSLPVLNLLHSCDNRKCVNPNHLREGTQQDNVNDAISRGRHAYGETNGRSKLNVAKVRAIREQYARGGVTHRGLAHQFHVSHGAIGRILRKVDWRHVN